MTDKERLKSIELEYEVLDAGNADTGYIEDSISFDDIGWLIEQVGRVQELESIINQNESVVTALVNEETLHQGW